MSRALVLGGNGQDGTYLVRSLLARGRDVVSFGVEDGPREAHEGRRFEYRRVDLGARAALGAALAEVEADEVYHFAAVHRSAAGAPYEARFGEMLDVNVGSVHVVLEALRARPGRMIYASSIKAFGEPPPSVIDEATPRRASCLYAVSKNAARDVIAYYREVHKVAGSVVYFGNHESPLRPDEFFIPKLARCLAERGTATFYSLDFYCDWGSAEEYADIVVDALERAPGEDFVIGTGRCVNARELVNALFTAHGLDAAHHVRESGAVSADRPLRYQLDTKKLERLVGRRPERRIEEVIAECVSAMSRSRQK